MNPIRTRAAPTTGVGRAASAFARLQGLLDLVLADHRTPDLEVAVRAWASQDPQAHTAIRRIDQARVAYLRGLWADMTGDEGEAADVGVLLYVILIGATQVLPRVEVDELRRMYELLLLRLAPARPANEPPAGAPAAPRSDAGRTGRAGT